MRILGGARAAAGARQPVGGPASIAGVWALKACDTIAQVLAADVSAALAVAGVRGFSIRILWKTLWANGGPADPLGLIQAALNVLKPGQKLAVRFVAGSNCPADVLANVRTYTATGVDPCSAAGNVLPLPFLADGTPNVPFEAFYDQELAFLAGIAEQHPDTIAELRAPQYGDDFAECNNGSDVQGLNGAYAGGGYSTANWVAAHERIFDLAYNRCMPLNLPLEHPLSGCGPLTTAGAQLAAYYATKPRADLVYVQANGLSAPSSPGGPGQTWGAGAFGTNNQAQEAQLRAGGFIAGVQHGLQMINPGDQPDWEALFGLAYQLNARTLEVYTGASFTGANAATLATQIAKFNANYGARTAAGQRIAA